MGRDDCALVRLPDAHRGEFRDPLGPVYTSVDELLEGAEHPIIAVGDMVSYHFSKAGEPPTIAVIDGRTERRAIDPAVEARLEKVPAKVIAAENPAGTITRSMVDALERALAMEPPVQIEVDGEEDLATVPAILLAPDGATIVYGQPGEGMVRVVATDESRARAADLLSLMKGNRALVAQLVAAGDI